MLFGGQAAEDAADGVEGDYGGGEENDVDDLSRCDGGGAEERAAEKDHQNLYSRYQKHYYDEGAVLPYV